jgi:hypothetical protein
MIRANWLALLGSLLAVSAPQVCLAKSGSPRTYVDEKTRSIVGGRKVLIVVDQDRLQPGIDSWLLGGSSYAVDMAEHFIDLGLLARGRKQIVPITDALQGYDFDTPMKEALTAVVGGIPWIRAQDIEFTHEGTNAAIENALNLSNTRQMLLLKARYETDDTYTAIIVSVEASLLRRQIPKGEHGDARLKSGYVPYRQTIRSVVSLPGADGANREQNIARWAADGARLARDALDIGLRRVPPLLVQNLQDDKKTSASWRERGDRKTVTRMSTLGWVVGPVDAGALFVEARGRSMNYLQMLAP